jgi:cytochrome P450
MGGSDTSATIIRVVFLYLMTSPKMMGNFRTELNDGIKSGRISSPIKDSEAKQLPYLQACIKEALRLWPPITGLLQKVVPPEGDTFNGTFIPGGTFIGYVKRVSLENLCISNTKAS